MKRKTKNIVIKFSKIILVQALTFSAYAQSNIVSKKNYTFEHDFKDVWAATQIILGSYPLDTNDLKNGLIKTTDLKPGQFWQPPFEKTLENKYTQTITLKFFKASSNRTELQILKQANLETDFLGSSQSVKTEPWEELRLIYKIKREIEIKKILDRI